MSDSKRSFEQVDGASSVKEGAKRVKKEGASEPAFEVEVPEGSRSIGTSSVAPEEQIERLGLSAGGRSTSGVDALVQLGSLVSSFTETQRTDSAHGRWTSEDSERLLDIVRRRGVRYGWKNIARELNNGRSAHQCAEHYKTLVPKAIRGHWKPHEDSALRTALKSTALPSGRVNWQGVLPLMGRRTLVQCQNRWRKLKSLAQVQGDSAAAGLTRSNNFAMMPSMQAPPSQFSPDVSRGLLGIRQQGYNSVLPTTSGVSPPSSYPSQSIGVASGGMAEEVGGRQHFGGQHMIHEPRSTGSGQRSSAEGNSAAKGPIRSHKFAMMPSMEMGSRQQSGWEHMVHEPHGTGSSERNLVEVNSSAAGHTIMRPSMMSHEGDMMYHHGDMMYHDGSMMPDLMRNSRPSSQFSPQISRGLLGIPHGYTGMPYSPMMPTRPGMMQPAFFNPSEQFSHHMSTFGSNIRAPSHPSTPRMSGIAHAPSFDPSPSTGFTGRASAGGGGGSHQLTQHRVQEGSYGHGSGRRQAPEAPAAQPQLGSPEGAGGPASYQAVLHSNGSRSPYDAFMASLGPTEAIIRSATDAVATLYEILGRNRANTEPQTQAEPLAVEDMGPEHVEEEHNINDDKTLDSTNHVASNTLALGPVIAHGLAILPTRTPVLRDEDANVTAREMVPQGDDIPADTRDFSVPETAVDAVFTGPAADGGFDGSAGSYSLDRIAQGIDGTHATNMFEGAAEGSVEGDDVCEVASVAGPLYSDNDDNNDEPVNDKNRKRPQTRRRKGALLPGSAQGGDDAGSSSTANTA